MDTACANNRPGSRFSVSVSTLVEVGKYCFLMGLILWLLARGTSELGYHWQWYRVPRFIFKMVDGRFVPGPLLQGLLVTFQIAVVSLALFFVFGVVTALMRRSSLFLFRTLARFYLELIRNTPLLIQLFFIYFALSPKLGLGAFASAVFALSLFEGAYASEIFRAGIDSIHKGQWEAAHSLGFSSFQTYRYVIFPQAIRYILPPLTGQAISLIKDSALVSTIAIYDLTMQGQAIVSETFLTFEIWFTVAGIYLAVTLTLSFLARVLERKLRMQ